MNRIALICTVALLTACSSQKSTMNSNSDPTHIKYPKTEKGNVEYSHFGTTIKDPYRWLEDDLSPKTEAWVTA